MKIFLIRSFSLLIAACFLCEARSETLTLDDAIRGALAHNQTVHVIDYGRQISRANLLEAWGHFDPVINFHDTYGENAAPNFSQPLIPQNVTTQDAGLTLDGLMPWGLSYSVGVAATRLRGEPGIYFPDTFTSGDVITVTQPLLRGLGFGANLYNVRIAKADRAISDSNYRQGVIDLVTNVIVYYNNLIEARESQRIAVLYRDNTAVLLSDNEKRFRAGTLAEADVIQARAQVAALEESVIITQRSVRDAENQLRRVMGAEHFEVDGPPIDIAPLPPVPILTVDPHADLKAALLRRPDYEAFRQGLYKLKAARSQATNQLLPRVDVVASAGYNGLDQSYSASWTQVKGDENRARSIGLIVSIPLTFTEGRGRARSARLSVRQSEEDLRRLEADISLEITTDAAQLETTKARIESLKNAYVLTEQTVQAEIKRLKAGTGDTFQVLTKQADLAQIQNRQVAAVSDQRRAIAIYQRAIASTLEVNHVNLE